MPKISAGVLLYRTRDGELEFLLAHPGGPFWKERDWGAWTIPKGEVQTGELPFDAACREFAEEIGFPPQGQFMELNPIVQKSGKVVHAWAVAGDCDTDAIQSNFFAMEWPPKSGQYQQCPEVDRAAFFRLAEARKKINPAQVPLLEELRRKIAGGS